MDQKHLLLVEDDIPLRIAIESYLGQQEHLEIKCVKSLEAAKRALEKSHFDVILWDVKMPGSVGFDLLEYVRQRHLSCPVVLMTANATIEKAVNAIKMGAYDFIVKPFKLDTIQNVICAALLDAGKISRLSTTLSLPAEGERAHAEKFRKAFIARDQHMRKLLTHLEKVAASKATVLIQGESGTGKELLARMIHESSPRRDKPFIAINCAALPDTLLESELFGHEKGSFTGAIQRHIGKFELSDGGTIFLDEISEMSLNMQTKLLRVLQECEIYRVGGSGPIPLNLRVVTSTNRELFRYMKAGHFREDLYYRVNVIPLTVPPLRARGNDVICLAEHFLCEFAAIHNKPLIELDEKVRHKIRNYPWYGNVRELRNFMERAILIGNFDQIVGEDLVPERQKAPEIFKAADGQSVPQKFGRDTVNMSLSDVEKGVICETLRRFNGNRTRTAEQLGISLRTLRNKLKTFKAQDEVDILREQTQEFI